MDHISLNSRAKTRTVYFKIYCHAFLLSISLVNEALNYDQEIYKEEKDLLKAYLNIV